MKNATIPIYIRFGELPKDGKSKVYASGEIVCTESGVSVWNCVESNGMYFPVLPDNPNEATIFDYFSMLFGDRPVYLVTGIETRFAGHDEEPCLVDPIIIKELPKYKTLKKGIEVSE